MGFINNSSLRFLRFDGHFNKPLDHLPETLKTLVVGYGSKQELHHLPASLTSLEIYSKKSARSINHLPTSLTHLRFLSCFEPSIHSLPKLTHLSFSNKFNGSISGKLPDTLQSLEIGNSFCQPLHSLPSSLQVLSSMYKASPPILVSSHLSYQLILFIFICVS